MPWPPAAFSLGIRSRTVRSSMIVFTATHSGSLSDEIVGRCSAGKLRQDAVEILAPHVEHQPDTPVRFDRRLQQQRDVLDLVPLPLVVERPRLATSCVFDSITVSRIRSRLARSVEPGFGRLDDGVGEDGRFHFGCAP